MSTVHNNQNDVVMSRAHFNLAALIVSILVIVLLILGYKLLQGPASGNPDIILNGESIPNDPKLKAFLEKRRFNLTVHVNADGSIKPVGPAGNEKVRCGEVRKGIVFPISGAADSCPTIPKQGIDLRLVAKIRLVRVNPICIWSGPFLIC